MTTRRLVIGTRGSDLALWQANHVKDALTSLHEGLTVELSIVKTKGDQIQDRPLHEVGGKGLFVREIEQLLLDGSIDLAVHSMKDLPAFMPDGLVLAATPERADPRDALVGKAGAKGLSLATLPAGTRLGTGSLRRGALAKRINPGLQVVPIRGNVPTRVGKVDSGEVDAVLLAAAGLERLGMDDRISELLDPDLFVPAPAQGILALQTRGDDDEARRLVGALGDRTTTIAAAAERGFLQKLEAGCTVPVACHATIERSDDGEQMTVQGMVVHPTGHPCFTAGTEGPTGDAAELGAMVAEALLALGAGAIVHPD